MRTLRLLLILASVNAFAQNDYFFPAGVTYDPAIPTPENFLGYPVGEWHTRHDRIVSYFQELARLSPKAHFQIIGYTYERRPQVVLTITSVENYARLEDIRLEHLKLSNPAQSVNLAGMPVIVTHGYNVHGNEPSSSEAAMLTAYYLIAAQGPEAEKTLRESVIHIDPNYNPDGRDRHSNWANMHKGFPPVADPADREHNEVWPGGRFNHYWFDLNRDWLPLAHPESRNRVAFFHKWLPNVCTDYHEMGTNGTNFFEPTKQFGSENPVVPRANYDQLNPLFAKYFSKALDDIGSLYFSKEVFDNSYPGYGSTYPDIHGGLGLVFEQASSRGHAQQSSTKVVTFAFTIRNHVRTSLATVKAAVENRELLLKHQQEFFKSALDEGRKSPVKAYVFGDSRDRGRTKEFANLLLQHKIEAYDLSSDLTLGKTKFEKGKAFVVPLDQIQSRLVRSMFEKVTKFQDSIFYDASTWTMALAFGMPHEPASTTINRGARLTADSNNFFTVEPETKPSYAYIIDWAEYYAPAALYEMLKNGVFVKTSFRPFTVDTEGARRTFVAGSLVISLADQDLPSADVHRIVADVASRGWVAAYPVNTGLTIEGTNLGSGSIRTVAIPKTAMLVGDGVAATEAGFAWFQMDSKLNMPVTKINTTQFGNFRLNDYNTLIMVSGGYNALGEAGAGKIKAWMQQGGTLILVKSAISWAIQNKVIDELAKKEDDKKETVRMDFNDAPNYQGSRAIGGSIYMTDLDITHPLGFGYTTRSVPVWRNHAIFIEPSKNSVNTVAKMTESPLLSGYVHSANLTKIKNSPSLMVSNVGQGRAVLFVDDPNFRGYWYGTSKMFFNAIFFGSQMSAPSFDAEH